MALTVTGYGAGITGGYVPERVELLNCTFSPVPDVTDGFETDVAG